MGMVNYQPELEDDYSSEVIRLARERSPNIDAWIAEQRYLNEVSEDNLSALWLRNRCVIMICSDLEELGITVNKEPDLVCDDPRLVYSVLMLRKKFDVDELYDLFKSHPDLVEVVKENLGQDTFEDILNWCKTSLPLDEGWDMINTTMEEYPEIFEAENTNFLNNINDVLSQIDALGAPDVTSEVDQDTVLKYIGLIGKRQSYIRQVADTLWVNRAMNDYERKARSTMLDNLMKDFEKHLGNKKVIIQYANEIDGLNLEDREAVVTFLDKIRQPYRCYWNNCLEFYVGEAKKPCPPSVLSLILATLVVDSPSLLRVNDHIGHVLVDYQDRLGSEAINKMNHLFQEMLANIVEPLEMNYHEAN